jgi:hypothetical protein
MIPRQIILFAVGIIRNSNAPGGQMIAFTIVKADGIYIDTTEF